MSTILSKMHPIRSNLTLKETLKSMNVSYSFLSNSLVGSVYVHADTKINNEKMYLVDDKPVLPKRKNSVHISDDLQIPILNGANNFKISVYSDCFELIKNMYSIKQDISEFSNSQLYFIFVVIALSLIWPIIFVICFLYLIVKNFFISDFHVFGKLDSLSTRYIYLYSALLGSFLQIFSSYSFDSAYIDSFEPWVNCTGRFIQECCKLFLPVAKAYNYASCHLKLRYFIFSFCVIILLSFVLVFPIGYLFHFFILVILTVKSEVFGILLSVLVAILDFLNRPRSNPRLAQSWGKVEALERKNDRIRDI